ncbi:Fe-Mn family superoxide dismutase, variant [Jaminaea rosea]|uniref:Superoxide dismutase n=1 Tax=Jaminaea rosea TaxID=1569628 RepID=A0A316UZA0_9BASI|nr:Fe-Mn family superoxide dismutase, variant [Jaminaea rosea]PWN30619.1 Fe-Mn family superoxide dismutase, variant [Jaminaea rosea]
MIRTALARSTAAASAASRSTVASLRMKHTLPKLPYDYNALEPAISAQIMEIHHSKHHNTYVNNLNAAEETLSNALAKNDVKGTIASQSAIKFNGGGHVNHSLFWLNLAPEKEGGGKLVDGQLKAAIEKQFGGLDELKKKVNAQALAIQGSGWAWLGYDPSTKSLDIVTTKDQDPLLSHVPLVGIDMWEHSYYLQHQNNKAAYLENVWKVVNWKTAEERMKQAN